MMTNRTRGIATALLLAGSFALTGCIDGSMPSPEMASAKVPVVSQTMMAYDLGASSGGSLSHEQRQSLVEWLDTIGIGYGDRVSVDDNGPGADMRRAVIAGALAQYGLLLSETSPITPTSANGDGVRVIVMRAAATVPGCPDFTRMSNPEFEASKMSNYGCASAGNIAMMVADANDLVSGKDHTSTDALTTVKSIQSYRKGAGKAKARVKNTAGTVGSSSN